MNKIIKLSMVVATATLLISCGGGSSSNGGAEEGIISTGDKCIEMAEYPKLGKYRYKFHGLEKIEFSSEEVLKSNANTFELKRTFTAEGFIIEKKSELYIKNNYIHTTKDKEVKKLLNGEILSEETLSYEPYIRIPAGKVCKGQSWLESYKWTQRNTYTNGRKSTSTDKTAKYTILIKDVGVLKTVEAGEFSTYVMYFEDNITHSTATIWRDVETGMVVQHDFSVNGVFLGTDELIEITH